MRIHFFGPRLWSIISTCTEKRPLLWVIYWFPARAYGRLGACMLISRLIHEVRQRSVSVFGSDCNSLSSVLGYRPPPEPLTHALSYADQRRRQPWRNCARHLCVKHGFCTSSTTEDSCWFGFDTVWFACVLVDSELQGAGTMELLQCSDWLSYTVWHSAALRNPIGYNVWVWCLCKGIVQEHLAVINQDVSRSILKQLHDIYTFKTTVHPTTKGYSALMVTE